MQTILVGDTREVSWRSVLAGPAFAITLCFVLLTLGFSLVFAAISAGSNDIAGSGVGATGSPLVLRTDSGVQQPDVHIESLLRSAPGAEARNQADDHVHADLWAILFRDLVDGRLSPEDYRHAVQLVASQTGLTLAQAQLRVQTVVDEARQVIAVAEQEAFQQAPIAAGTAVRSSADSALRVFVMLFFGALLATLIMAIMPHGRQPEAEVAGRFVPAARSG